MRLWLGSVLFELELLGLDVTHGVFLGDDIVLSLKADFSGGILAIDDEIVLVFALRAAGAALLRPL